MNAGVTYVQSSGTVTVDAADEGVQGAFVTVTGGTLSITSGDDGINASNGTSEDRRLGKEIRQPWRSRSSP